MIDISKKYFNTIYNYLTSIGGNVPFPRLFVPWANCFHVNLFNIQCLSSSFKIHSIFSIISNNKSILKYIVMCYAYHIVCALSRWAYRDCLPLIPGLISGNKLRLSSRWGECDHGEGRSNHQLFAGTKSDQHGFGKIHVSPKQRKSSHRRCTRS